MSQNEIEIIELLGEVIRVASNMAQELQDFVDEAEQAGCEKPLPGTQALIAEWNEIYNQTSHFE